MTKEIENGEEALLLGETPKKEAEPRHLHDAGDIRQKLLSITAAPPRN